MHKRSIEQADLCKKGGSIKKCAVWLLLPLLLLTGCSSETFSDRLYTRAIGLTNKNGLQMSVQVFEEDGCRTVQAQSIEEALRLEQAIAGGRVFVGHTELLCLDGTCTLDEARSLFFGQGLSPGCKLLYADPENYLKNTDSTSAVHTLRMAERDGLTPVADLSTALEEWLGAWETALVPSGTDELPTFILLHTDGSFSKLSEKAAAGMRWLRRNTGSFSVTLEGGKSEATVSRIRLYRHAADGVLYYEVRIHTKGSQDDLRQALTKQVQEECEAAVGEMLAARADVIGMQ
ncbi:MAG: hypothetical protein K2I93_06100, partial [Oscillospiraceae bacterium]|nr:hypothetical protein [Oscillospiraceae bacterium]